MVKHIIIWTLKEENNTPEIKSTMKIELENLLGKVPGLLEMKIEITPFGSSNGDVMLYSVFENADALKGYSIHPEHVRVADTFVRPFTKTRASFDYEV